MQTRASSVHPFPLQGPPEGAVSEEGGLFQAMVSTSTDEMAYIDGSYVLRAANPAFLDAVRRIRSADQSRAAGGTSEHVGALLEDVLGEDEFLSSVQPHLDRALAGAAVSVQRWVERPGLPSRFVHVQYLPHRNHDGEVIGVVSVVRDLTAEKHAQALAADLAADERIAGGSLGEVAMLLTERAAESLGVDRLGVWLLVQDGSMLRGLDVYDPISGRHEGRAAVSKAVSNAESAAENRSEDQRTDLDEDDFPAYFAALRQGRMIDAGHAIDDPRTVELVLGLAPRRVASVLAAPIRHGGVVAGVLQAEVDGAPRIWQPSEISFLGEVAAILGQTLASAERRRLERRLFQAEKMESLGLMAGGIAHDFNNLLTGVLAHSELLLAEIDGASVASRRVRSIRDQAMRASELCNQMLAFTGRSPFHAEPLDLSDLARDAVDEVRSRLPQGTRLVLDLPSDLPQVAVGVAALHQAVVQVLDNAVEALEGGGEIAVSTRAEERTGVGETDGFVGEPPAAGRYAVLRVADDGCGVDEATIARIFEPFFSTKFTGRGLGLASVLGTVRGHRGAVRVASTSGRGTQVELFLPVD